MVAYILAFLAVAVFPMALAAIGGYLATLAVPDSKQKRKWLVIVWALAGCGVLFAALQQIEAHDSDVARDSKTTSLQSTLNTSLQDEAYMRGQLGTIAVTIGKVGEKTSDPVTMELASAIAKMANGGNSPPPPKDVHVSLYYENRPLNGDSIKPTAPNGNTISMSSFQVKLNGSSTAALSVRLYLSAPMNNASMWQVFASEEPGFPTAIWEGTTWPVSPQETWSTSEFVATFRGVPLFPIAGKLKVFYGADKPVEANFTIVKPQ